MVVSINDIAFRRLEPDDAEVLAAFYNGLSPASKRTFRPLGVTTTVRICADIALANAGACPTKFDLVATCGDSIVGWGFLWDLAAEGPDLGPTFGLAVADEYHHRGIGAQLITQVMAWARSQELSCVLLTVVQDNAVAWRLYEKQGFARYGEFIGEDGLPYYRMRAELVGGNG